MNSSGKKRRMPKQKPHRSVQTYGTPVELLQAVKRRLHIGAFACDLAASAENAVAPLFYSEGNSAFDNTWNMGTGVSWLNPPFENIKPWVEKAWEESQKGAHVVMLLPASVGSNWYKDYVHQKAYVVFISPRITFVGETTPYPKDLMLCVYQPFSMHGTDVWRWDEV